MAHWRHLIHHAHIPLGRHVPAADTAKRLKQLLIEHVTKAQLARALGCPDGRYRLHTDPGDWITLRNELKLKRLHRHWLGGPIE